ncbi:MAG: hypothetical protein GX418_02070 [Clostridiales bacterium]|nr:hypothetical protein [Clostridiales bacterium]
MYNNDELSYIPRPDCKKIKPINTFFISADLGQTTDYTAISITERISSGVNAQGFVNTFHLRHIERPPRGTEYPAIIDRLIEIYRSPQLEKKYKAVVIDLTGLGRPVYDMMRKAGFHESLYAISITGGNAVTRDRRIFNVPKRDLITNLQILFQNGALQIARGMKEADALVDELLTFQTKISDTGMDTYGARSGAHDDIVLSVAMGAWLANRETWDMGYDRVM